MKTVNDIPVLDQEIPHLTTEQMIEVDRLMIEEYKIELIQMMENAGRNLAILSKKAFKDEIGSGKVIVLAGTGGNGGGALVCARRLFAWGFDVTVYVTDAENMTPIPEHQLTILRNMKVEIKDADSLSAQENVSLIIDGVIGYSLKGNPFGAAKTMIDWANEQDVPVVSLDTPSGIDLTTGTIYDPAVKANATLTLALPKKGLYTAEVLPLRGDLFLGDISVPGSLYAEPSLGLSVEAIFQESDILKLD